MTRLTKKEKDFAQEYAKTGNGTQSILKTYNTTDPKTASVMAVENLAKPRVQNLILSIADSIPDSLLVEKHLELLNSEGDATAVKAGLDMAYKLKGSYAAEKREVKVEDKTEAVSKIKQLTETINAVYRGGSVSSDGGSADSLDNQTSD